MVAATSISTPRFPAARSAGRSPPTTFGACGTTEPQSRPHPGAAFFNYQRARPRGKTGRAVPRLREAGTSRAPGREARLFRLPWNILFLVISAGNPLLQPRAAALCPGVPPNGSRSAAARCGCCGSASVTAQRWSLGTRKPNLTFGAVLGGRSAARIGAVMLSSRPSQSPAQNARRDRNMPVE